MSKRVNKGQQIYDTLREKIEKGVFKPGELLPTDMELCSEFDTSRPTVAKSIQKLVVEGLLIRKAGLGTYLKDDISKGGTAKEFSFGLLIPSLGETEIFEPICGQIAQMADQYCFKLLWGGTAMNDSKAQVVEQLAQKYIAQEVDGVFFNPLELEADAEATNLRVMNLFARAKIPVVLLDSDISEAPATTSHDLVGINNLEAGYVMGQHLVEMGSKKIAFCTRPYAASTVHLRWMGLCEALQNKTGMSAEKLSSELGDEAMVEEILSQKFDAVVASNDAMAAELMLIFSRLGVEIPAQIKLSGFDDVKYAELLKVPLTTYHQPCRDIGVAAVETMMSRLKAPELMPRRVSMVGELKVRESTSKIN